MCYQKVFVGAHFEKKSVSVLFFEQNVYVGANFVKKISFCLTNEITVSAVFVREKTSLSKCV